MALQAAEVVRSLMTVVRAFLAGLRELIPSSDLYENNEVSNLNILLCKDRGFAKYGVRYDVDSRGVGNKIFDVASRASYKQFRYNTVL